jgi:EAL domain-containing protein (putative c-di-GMP-specific phosphodiesterase class I)
MYCAKETSRGSQQVFEHAMHDRLVADVQVENDIRAALEAERLTVRYDPIADLRDGAIVGFEAALYWETGNGGLLGPSEYTDVARQSGLSGRLGWIALRQTFLSAGSLDEPAPFLIAPTPMPLLRQTDFLEQLDREVRDTAARPNRVVLAIPEEAAGSPDAAGLLAAIRERGFRISLSDFGFGGASLRQLCRLPLDFARIDPADLQRSATAGAESSLLQAMIKLCLDLQIQVIAFGVRGEDERRLLHGMGCTLGQGSLFGAALRPEQLERVLRRAWASSTGERSA